MWNHKTLYPEPEELIGDKDDLKNYIQWWIAIQEYSQGEPASLKTIPQDQKTKCRQTQRKLQDYGYYLNYITWTYENHIKRAIPHWSICAWSEKGLLRPQMLKPDWKGEEDYHRTHWKLYAAPELLFHASPPIDPIELKRLIQSDKYYPTKDEVRKLVESIIKPIP